MPWVQRGVTLVPALCETSGHDPQRQYSYSKVKNSVWGRVNHILDDCIKTLKIQYKNSDIGEVQGT